MARSSFLFRTDPRTLAALRRWADDDLRSMNAQLEFIVRRALKEAGRLPGPDAPAKDDGDREQ
ncbi:MAG: hypothetical protein AAGA68_02760 [Pseudomonadota bacterium]